MGDAGWSKCAENPVLGPGLGTAFDGAVLHDGTQFKVWFSWRDCKSIGYATSSDGGSWNVRPTPVLSPTEASWDRDVNRPGVVFDGDLYRMWYSGVAHERMQIGLALSADGIHWQRHGAEPVLGPDQAWEKQAVMCPCVVREQQRDGCMLFKMWYSAGELYEPDAIGYAESDDGIAWRKDPRNPIFVPSEQQWERSRVSGGDVQRVGDGYCMFYIGFGNGFEDSAIGAAHSPDGISGWKRNPANPLIRPGPAGAWDDCNVYKPFIARVGSKWFLWYNASRCSDRREQIGLATHDDFQFC